MSNRFVGIRKRSAGQSKDKGSLIRYGEVIHMTIQKRTAISVFMVAFAFGLNITGIMPVLSMISEAYSDIDISMIQMLQTLPYLLLMVGSVATGFLASWFSKKSLQIFGLLLIGICGVLPFFTESFGILLMSRILIGFGFGIVSPLNTAVIAEFIEPDKRSAYLGLHVVGMGLGGMIGNVVGGFLAKLGLRFFYLIYLIPFLSVIVVAAVLPRTKPSVTPAKKGKKIRVHITAMVWILSAFSFLHTLFINSYNTNISLFLSQNVTSDTGASGVVTGVNAVFALIVGMAFSKISGVLKNKTLPVAVFSAAAGYAAALWIPGMAGVLICSALCGVSLSAFMAMSSFLISVCVEPDAVAMASSIFSVIGGIGGLIAPIVMGGLAGFLGGNTARNQFEAACIGMALLGMIVSFVTLSRKESAKQTA